MEAEAEAVQAEAEAEAVQAAAAAEAEAVQAEAAAEAEVVQAEAAAQAEAVQVEAADTEAIQAEAEVHVLAAPPLPSPSHQARPFPASPPVPAWPPHEPLPLLPLGPDPRHPTQ